LKDHHQHSNTQQARSLPQISTLEGNAKAKAKLVAFALGDNVLLSHTDQPPLPNYQEIRLSSLARRNPSPWRIDLNRRQKGCRVCCVSA
jgi:hypothetical protein